MSHGIDRVCDGVNVVTDDKCILGTLWTFLSLKDNSSLLVDEYQETNPIHPIRNFAPYLNSAKGEFPNYVIKISRVLTPPLRHQGSDSLDPSPPSPSPQIPLSPRRDSRISCDLGCSLTVPSKGGSWSVLFISEKGMKILAWVLDNGSLSDAIAVLNG